MPNKIITFILSIFIFAAFGCGSSDNQKVSTDTKAALVPITQSTPEVAAFPIVAETPANELKQVKEAVKNATVITENASLRAAGGQNGEVLDVIPEGANVEVIRQKGVWFFVRVDEKTGWMHGNTIRFDSAPANRYTAATENLSSADYNLSLQELSPDTEPLKAIPPPVYSTPAPITRYEPTPEIYTQRTPAYEPEPTVSSNTPSAICADGTVSYSANRQGTCSHHGGVAEWLGGSKITESERTNLPSYQSDDTTYRPKTVQVKGYFRKDGTYVRPHTRSAPHKRN